MVIDYWSDLRRHRLEVHGRLIDELSGIVTDFRAELAKSEQELLQLSRSEPLRTYVSLKIIPSVQTLGVRDGLSRASESLPGDLQALLAAQLRSESHLAHLVLYNQQRQPTLFAEPTGRTATTPVAFYLNNFRPGLPNPDDRVWNTDAPELLSVRTSNPSYGPTLVSTAAIQTGGTRESALVSELKLSSLFSTVAQRRQPPHSDRAPLSHQVIVLDESDRILFHPNDALKHQMVSTSMPGFMPVAKLMQSGQSGIGEFTSAAGHRFIAAFGPIPELSISIAVASAYRPAWLFEGVTRVLLAAVIAAAGAFLLTAYSQRRTRGLERVKEGVAAIAKGQLDHRIEVQSGDNARPLADNINLMTKRLREQIAGETEARQFESFVKLSAMLTHDLKNAIEALSLIVGNMERHFDNEEFRSDALRALTSSTEKLKTLVTRLSNPVVTLSGEHKRPKPIDLVPILRRVISLTAEPLSSTHIIDIRLPDSLWALADPERLEKVVENLVLNALEAMTGMSGTLRVEAGDAEAGTIFFSVSDTGRGISQEFIKQRLFRPFATTKKTGVGLGLYTCREVVRAHNGFITVESSEGIGTTFRVVLPSPPPAN